MKLLYYTISLLLLGLYAPCMSQQLNTLDITSAGGHISGSGGTANIAIGQVAYARRTPGANDYIVREGVLQLFVNTNPLPISLLTFDVAYETDKHQAVLNWTTSTEQNNDFFMVERSTDGLNFESIGQVQGAGNSDVALHYEWIDEQPKEGISYYRLKQVDFDGKFSYSPTRHIYIETTGMLMSVYPNPTQSHITINIPQLPANGANYRLVNVAGQVIAEGKLYEVQQQIDLSSLPTATYLLQLEGLPSAIHTIKIIKL